MRGYAEIFLDLTRTIKRVHELKLKNDHTEAYLLSCDITDYAQELEDVLQKDASIQ
jgi:hypothetical protein